MPQKNIQVKKGGKSKKQVGVICEPDLANNHEEEPDVPMQNSVKKKKEQRIDIEEEQKVAVEENNPSLMDFAMLQAMQAS